MMSYISSLSELIVADPSLKPANQSEMEIIHMLSSDQKMFRLYRDVDLIERIKKVVPIADLTNKCSQRMLNLHSSDPSTSSASGSQPLVSRDVFFLLLLEWFKNDFFTWFDCGYCESCKMPMRSFGRSPPTREEAKWDASNVEVYRCDDCSATERFPRYNRPLKLLETRKGRCGEWRNCFSAICVAFNYEIRLVHDLQDHVWNEVYLESQGRWVHCDCCENAFDSPLMYEAGWGKKHVYCIGTSEYEFQDVTMRYTHDLKGLLRRRERRCRPEWLNRYLLYISAQSQHQFDSSLKTKFLNRRLAELSSFIVVPGFEKRLKESEKQGRNSGAIGWRLARGECSSTPSPNYIITFSRSNNSDGNHSFKYRSVADKYLIDDLQMKDWRSAVFSFENIIKKTERDWKMTYLCRSENSDCTRIGTLVYKFDVRFDWESMEVRLNSKCYGTGKVSLTLTSEPGSFSIELEPNELNRMSKSELDGETDFVMLTVNLSGGEGDIGWQQAQLFRHSTRDQEDDYSMEITFDPK